MGRVRVLVADGQLLLADALAIALRHDPAFEVLDEYPTAGQDAVAAAAGLRPDVAVVDFRLRGMRGPAVVRAVLAQSPATAIIHLSASYAAGDIEQSLAAGATGFLPKDVRVNVVAEAVRRAHDGERPVLADRLADLMRTMARKEEDQTDLAGRVASLTLRQQEILGLLAEGLSVLQIGERLGIRPGTVRTHVHRILRTTGARSQLEAVALAREGGFLA